MSTTLGYVTECITEFSNKWSFSPEMGKLDLCNLEREEPVVVWTLQLDKLDKDNYNGLYKLWNDYQYVISASSPSRYYMDGYLETDIRTKEDCSLQLRIVFERMYLVAWDHIKPIEK